MSDLKDFKKPLGEWVEESTPIEKKSVDPMTGKIITTTEIAKTKVMYIHAPKVKIRCKDGEHVFRVADIHKYIFQCTNCRFARQVFPTTYKFVLIDKDLKIGMLVHRITGHRV